MRRRHSSPHCTRPPDIDLLPLGALTESRQRNAAFSPELAYQHGKDVHHGREPACFLVTIACLVVTICVQFGDDDQIRTQRKVAACVFLGDDLRAFW
jgi:hypothetical protein